jgi:hypothetical protein
MGIFKCGEIINSLLIAVFREMPVFKAPVYSKKINANGVSEPSYTFNITYNDSDEYLTLTIDPSEEVTLKSLHDTILSNLDWWREFVSVFLQSSAKSFAKPYTFDSINKVMKHTLVSDMNDVQNRELSQLVTFIPRNIQIQQGAVLVNWCMSFQDLVIDIPDLNETTEETKIQQSETLPVSNNSNGDTIQEIDINEIAESTTYSDSELQLESPNKYYEKQRVKESRLKAKLAYYKAQRQMNQYYEKYGTDVSDSDSDEESTDESENEN